MNYYTILNISSSATKSDIKQAYRKLAKKFHPDRNPNNPQAEQKFLQISEAYQILSDDKKRAAYDEKGSQSSHQQQASQGKQTAKAYNSSDIASQFANASNFEQFFGFTNEGKKMSKKKKEPLNTDAMFEQFFKR